MKFFFISLILSVLFSLCYLTIWINNDFEFSAKNKKIKVILNSILPLSSCIFILFFIFFNFYLYWVLGVVTIFFGFIIFVFWNYDFSDIVRILLCSIIIFIFFMFYPIDRTNSNANKNEETKQVISLYNCSNDTNNNTVIINISNIDGDDTKNSLYTIMEYKKDSVENFEIPSTIKTLDNFKITKDGDNKLEIITNIEYKETVLSYFGFSEPYRFENSKYTLYITENNVMYSNI